MFLAESVTPLIFVQRLGICGMVSYKTLLTSANKDAVASKTGQRGRDFQDKEDRISKPRHDSQEKTTRTQHSGKDSQDRTARKGQSGQGRGSQDNHERTGTVETETCNFFYKYRK